MKKVIFAASFVLFVSFQAVGVKAQNAGKGFFRPPSIFDSFSRPAPAAPISRYGSAVRNIQKLGENSGVAFTGAALFRTDDDGATWREMPVPKNSDERIAAVFFQNETIGWAITADSPAARLAIAETGDGGNSWTRTPIRLRNEDASETDLETASLGASENGDLILKLRVPTTSNFIGQTIYKSSDGGRSWEFKERDAEIRRDDTASTEKVSGAWRLVTAGDCEAAKAGCVQETRIFNGGGEITPPPIIELARLEKENAKAEARSSIFAQPPAGSTRISLNRGFDKCTAATPAQMQTWWNSSPFYDSNIYISGRNRGCTQAQLSANWVNQVSAMGWGLIPTIVGYQAPCSVCTSCQKHSSDAATAETQGRGEADISIADAGNLGLTQGTVLYYDMERYDETSATPGCRTSVNAFLKGWTDRVKERGYISGVYGSPTNAVADWMNIPAASRMDAVWLARWDNVPSVWSYAAPSPVVPTTVWANHQRIKQWQAPHDETWGGVTFNIDGNISDAPVAGVAIAKNKPADFDGDGKSDISVYRPDAGNWFALNSSNGGFNAVTFGGATDILAPGDYDGDGKTDQAVFRPENGVWYFRTKAGFTNARQFGASGDVPVPADYNGDGKTDVAVFRPSNGVWYIANSDSLGTFTFVQFGQTGDKAVPGDYDGDFKTDIAVFRPETGSWFVRRSSDGVFSAANFGAATDQPAPGDYDGDGKTDIAVFRAGTWYLQRSTAGFVGVQFGASGDLPTVGDYDGDNKSDIAVYRPSNGAWYLLQSQTGFSATAFGNATDKPIPNAYLAQ